MLSVSIDVSEVPGQQGSWRWLVVSSRNDGRDVTTSSAHERTYDDALKAAQLVVCATMRGAFEPCATLVRSWETGRAHDVASCATCRGKDTTSRTRRAGGMS